MGLPDRGLGEAQVEVLADLPRLLDVVKIKPDHVAAVAVLEPRDPRLCRFETPFVLRRHPAVVQQPRADGPADAVEEPEQDARDEEALQLHPVADDGADVHHSQDVVRLAEELVARQADPPGRGKDPQQDEQAQRDEPPLDVQLRDKRVPYVRLRLVQRRLDDDPGDRVHGGLDQDDVADPAVEEHEALVGDAGDGAEERLAARQQDRERREGICQNADAVGKGSQGGARVVDAGRALHRRNPGLVGYADEGEDDQVAREDEEYQHLQAGDMAEDSGRKVREEVCPAETRHGSLEFLKAADGLGALRFCLST